MKRYLPFALIPAAAVAAIVLSERHKIAARPGSQAVLRRLRIP